MLAERWLRPIFFILSSIVSIGNMRTLIPPDAKSVNSGKLLEGDLVQAIAYFKFTFFDQVYLLSWKELMPRNNPSSTLMDICPKKSDFSRKKSNLALNEKAFIAVFNQFDMLGHCL